MEFVNLIIEALIIDNIISLDCKFFVIKITQNRMLCDEEIVFKVFIIKYIICFNWK